MRFIAYSSFGRYSLTKRMFGETRRGYSSAMASTERLIGVAWSLIVEVPGGKSYLTGSKVLLR